MVALKVLSLEVKIILWILVIAGLVAAGFTINSWRTSSKANAESVDELNQTGKATTAIGTEFDNVQSQVSTVEDRASTSRVEYIHTYERIRDENPAVRAATDLSVPLQLRHAACLRRESRERSGNLQAGDQGTDEAQAACRRYAEAG